MDRGLGDEVEIWVCLLKEISDEVWGEEGLWASWGRGDFRMRGILACSEAEETELEERTIIVPPCLLYESWTPQPDVYKVLHSLPLANSARLPPYLPLFYSNTLVYFSWEYLCCSPGVWLWEVGCCRGDASGLESGVLWSNPGSSIY